MRNKYYIRNDMTGYSKMVALTKEQVDLLYFLDSEGLLEEGLDIDAIEDMEFEEI